MGTLSGIPEDIPGLGSVAVRPSQNPTFRPDAGFTTEDYFVWSRCDGSTTVRDIILMVGLGTEKTVSILQKLRSGGAVLLEGETEPPQAIETDGDATASRRRPSPPRDEPVVAADVGADIFDGDSLDDLTAEELTAMAEDVALTDPEKRRIIVAHRKATSADYFELLGVTPASDKRDVKRAYFRISKEFHPDRHYGEDLGSFAPWLKVVFEAVTRAFQVLSNKKRRNEYMRDIGMAGGERQSQTAAEHGADLFERACEAELCGEPESALKLFAAALQVIPESKNYKRAALCALRANQNDVAFAYAEKAVELKPNDPSTLRVLADVLRARSDLVKAKEILEFALEQKTENDKLVGELQADLQMVCAQLGDSPVTQE